MAYSRGKWRYRMHFHGAGSLCLVSLPCRANQQIDNISPPRHITNIYGGFEYVVGAGIVACGFTGRRLRYIELECYRDLHDTGTVSVALPPYILKDLEAVESTFITIWRADMADAQLMLDGYVKRFWRK